MTATVLVDPADRTRQRGNGTILTVELSEIAGNVGAAEMRL